MTKFQIHLNEKYKETSPADFFIQILEGPFAGVEFTIGKITHNGTDADGVLEMGFDWDPMTELDEGVSVTELEATVASIVHQIMEDMANAEEHVTQEEITESA